MNSNMTKAAARPPFQKKPNYTLQANFETLSLNVAQTKYPHNKHN